MSDFDVAVVGGGAAGLVCATAAARAGSRVVLYEAFAPGGQLLNLADVHLVAGVPTPLSGVDLATSLMDAAMEAGVELRFEQVAHAKADGDAWVVAAGEPCRSTALVIATGSSPTPLPVDGAERFVGAGISYCAVCDGPLFAGMPVAVVGSGDHAALEAAHLADVADRVVFVTSETPTASAALLARANIDVVAGARVTALDGEAQVSSLRYETPDGTEGSADVAGVFVVIGRTPNDIDIEAAGGVLRPPFAVDATMAVDGAPHLFAIGEARASFPMSVIAAMGDGLQAANAIASLLSAQAEH